jgi:hypothetical protein
VGKALEIVGGCIVHSSHAWYALAQEKNLNTRPIYRQVHDEPLPLLFAPYVQFMVKRYPLLNLRSKWYSIRDYLASRGIDGIIPYNTPYNTSTINTQH